MGAFAAVLYPDAPGSPGVVTRMLAAAPHRGSRREVAVRGRAGVGIGNQPGETDAWLSDTEDYLAAVTGRIDNLTDLAKRYQEQESRGGASPSDVVVSVFRSLGDDAPAVFRGVYAAFVTDGRRAWTWRDHLSFGQSLYRQDARGFFVATEAKQVVEGAGIAKEPDVETVEGWFFGEVERGETPAALLGVRRAARGIVLTSDGRRTHRRRYWDPDIVFETARSSGDELVDRFDHLMDQAVERVLTGNDVVSLSGGIDSPAVAAYGAERHLELSGRPIGALSMVFPDFPEVDESRYIQTVARRYALDLHTFQPSARPLDDIGDWVRLCDSPCPIHPPAEAAEYYRLARSLGYTNVVGGDLAEYGTAQRAGLLGHLVAKGRLRTVPAVIRSQRDIAISWLGIARQLLSPIVPRSMMAARRRMSVPGGPAWLDEPRVRAANADAVVAPLRRYRWDQVGFFVGPPIGNEADATVQAACGVLNRRPWVDVDLAEFFISLPAEIKYPDFRFKTFVKRLLRGRVPDEILDRTDKTYFNTRILGTIDWDSLRRWLVRPSYRMPGIDYDVLAEAIDRREFTIADFKWAVDLAKTHAFMALWE